MPTARAEDASSLAAFAVELAMAARKETLDRSFHIGEVENKGVDGIFDPVTRADRAAEIAMRQLIIGRFPDHGISGEELDDKPSKGRFGWSLDPIDGTRSYICALPSWTTLVALLEEGEPVIGVIDAPRLDEIYVGTAKGAHMIRNGRRSPIATSGCKRVDEARFSTTDPFLLRPATSLLERIARSVRLTRYGLDGYGYARLAAGSLDLVIESGLKPHDYNALIPVVRGAGGYIGDWNGGNAFAAGDVIAAASPELYKEAVELILA